MPAPVRHSPPPPCLERSGNTSITVRVEVYAERNPADVQVVKVTEANLTYVAIDRDGKLHFDKPDIGGDPVVVLLGQDVTDAHLAELATDGVSYIVAEDAAMDIAPLLATLKHELGIERLLLEGGGHVNGSLLAAGLVDEISLLVAPAIDGGDGVTGAFDAGAAGLAGKAQLTMVAAEPMNHGVIHLRYQVLAP